MVLKYSMREIQLHLWPMNIFFLMEIARDEHNKRISQTEKEEMDSIGIEVELTEPNFPQEKEI